MPKVPDHVDLDALRAEQRKLATNVRIEDDLPDKPATMAGFDASYDRAGTGYGALCLVDAGSLEVREVHTTQLALELPYIPGLLAYRELPLFQALWPMLERRPDVLLVDGGGIIHPRRCGSACHMGLEAKLPSIGVTKALLVGEVQGELAGYQATAPVHDEGELVAYAYRSSRRATNPIYVSPGHRVTARTALDLVQRLCTGEHKLPEPLRVADREAGLLKRRQRHP